MFARGTKATPGVVADFTTRLPPELKHALLDCVERRSVITMGGVSRAWRSVATAHSLFYRQIDFQYNHTLPRPYDVVIDAMDETRRAGMRVSLALVFPHFMPDASRIKDQFISEFFPALSSALQDSVVRLSLVAPDRVFDELLPSLTVPAPQLRSLVLKRQAHAIHPLRHLGTISASIFGGHAAQLQSVEVTNVEFISHVPIPAFASARHVDLKSDGFAGDLYVSRVFPSARNLVMEIIYVYGLQHDRKQATLELNGTNLRSLVILQAPPFELVAKSIPSRIDSLALHNFSEIDLSAYLEAVPGPVNISISLVYGREQRAFSITEWSSRIGDRSVSYTPQSDSAIAGPMKSLGMRGAEISTLELGQATLRAVFQHWDGLVLPALRTLCITLDIVPRTLWPPPTHTHFELSQITVAPPAAEPLQATLLCPALRELTIRSSMPAEARTVVPDQVLLLGRALGLTSPALCALTLHQVSWMAPPAEGAIEALYSKTTIIEPLEWEMTYD